MADCDGQGIGRIGRLGDGRECKLQPHHLLNLLFAAASVARDCLFDLGRAVLENRNACRGGGQDGGSTNLADHKGRTYIQRDERRFNCDFVNLPLREQAANRVVDLEQPSRFLAG